MFLVKHGLFVRTDFTLLPLWQRQTNPGKMANNPLVHNLLQWSWPMGRALVSPRAVSMRGGDPNPRRRRESSLSLSDIPTDPKCHSTWGYTFSHHLGSQLAASRFFEPALPSKHPRELLFPDPVGAHIDFQKSTFTQVVAFLYAVAL